MNARISASIRSQSASLALRRSIENFTRLGMTFRLFGWTFSLAHGAAPMRGMSERDRDDLLHDARGDLPRVLAEGHQHAACVRLHAGDHAVVPADAEHTGDHADRHAVT